MNKLKLAVWKFTSCDGCQLSLLDCEDEILSLFPLLEIAYFREASSTNEGALGPFDLSLVEGSITTPMERKKILQVRRDSKILVVIGACAQAGGIQALRNFKDVGDFISMIYASAEYIDTLKDSSPVSSFIPVDFELRGCPIDKRQLLETISAFLHGRKPNISAQSVCIECKLMGNVCVMVAHGTPCLGPVTHAGCGAICPSYLRGCYGCFGPSETPNTSGLSAWMRTIQGLSSQELELMFHHLNSFSPHFKEEGLKHVQKK